MFLVKNFKLLVVVGLVCAMALGPVSAEDETTPAATGGGGGGAEPTTPPKTGGMKCGDKDCGTMTFCTGKKSSDGDTCVAECPSVADADGKCNDDGSTCCCKATETGCKTANGTATALIRSFGGLSFVTLMSALVYFIPTKTLS